MYSCEFYETFQDSISIKQMRTVRVFGDFIWCMGLSSDQWNIWNMCSGTLRALSNIKDEAFGENSEHVKLLTILAKSSILDVCQGSGYASDVDYTDQIKHCVKYARIRVFPDWKIREDNSLYWEIRVGEKPYFGIFYTVKSSLLIYAIVRAWLSVDILFSNVLL